jgi:hypothetical protein
MMAKRRFIYAGIFAACVALLLAVLAALSSRTGVTKANYDRIAEGMTLAEVQKIFGKEGIVFHGFPNETARAYCWENADRSLAILFFDDNSKVVEKAKWADSTESIVDKIRRLIGWPWWK